MRYARSSPCFRRAVVHPDSLGIAPQAPEHEDLRIVSQTVATIVQMRRERGTEGYPKMPEHSTN